MVDMSSQATLDMIYEEIRKVNEKLSLIEEVIEEVITKGLPEVELTEKESKQIEASVKEMKKGNYVTIEELKRV